MVRARPAFLSLSAPEGYVAGIGRGAQGFTTRSDLGPAKAGPTDEDIQAALAKRAAQLKGDTNNDQDNADPNRDPENDTGLFAHGNYDQEDDEADRLYQMVDDKLERRRKPQREAQEQAEREEFERQNPKFQQQFADLKRALGTVSDQDWANLPEVGDLTGRNKRARIQRQQNQRFYAVPDSVLAGARDAGELGTTIADDADASNDNQDGGMTNFADIGHARKKVLDARLDQAAGTTTTSGTMTSIADSKSYLSSLTKSELKAGELPVGDIARARVLLDSVIKTNMRAGPGWIAAARLEELDGKYGAAQSLLTKACTHCPKSEDVWLEAIHMETRRNGKTGDLRNARIIAARAVGELPRSSALWIEAMKLEHLPNVRKRVLRKALDHVPQSVSIWKEAVNLEDDPADAKLMLAKATEMIPLSVDLWLALARLETPDAAQIVLNKARKANPSSYEIWIAAARLHEQLGNEDVVSKVLERAVKALAKANAMLKREEWKDVAEKCEDEDAPLTCKAIVEHSLGWELDEDDTRKQIWLADADKSINSSHFQTARAIYAYAIRVFASDDKLWSAAASMEKKYGTPTALTDILSQSVEACPHSEKLWMQLAREKASQGELLAARQVLGRAFQHNAGSEDIWLTAVRLELDHDAVDEARRLLATARQEAGTDRVWIRSVAFERQLNQTDAALEIVLQGLDRFPRAAKLWILKGQIYLDKRMTPQAREAFNAGTRAAPKSVPLWILASRLEEKDGILVKARSILDRARLANPRSGELWTETVRLERRAGNIAVANQKMAQGLQEVPTSGLLWTERIWHLEARTQRKQRVLEAIKRVDSDPLLYVLAARIFWSERKLEKAALWFSKAAAINPDQGDTWAWWYKFLMQHGTKDKQDDVIKNCILYEPRHGEVWQAVRKAPENASKSTEQILKLVVERLE